jgi:hypothetical protein
MKLECESCRVLRKVSGESVILCPTCYALFIAEYQKWANEVVYDVDSSLDRQREINRDIEDDKRERTGSDD